MTNVMTARVAASSERSSLLRAIKMPWTDVSSSRAAARASYRMMPTSSMRLCTRAWLSLMVQASACSTKTPMALCRARSMEVDGCAGCVIGGCYRARVGGDRCAKDTPGHRQEAVLQ